MAKFYGKVGYGEAVETPAGSGIWEDEIVEYPYFGDVVRQILNPEKGESINDDIKLNNSVRIVADQYAMDHFMKIKYVRWAGALFTVTSVEVQSPRLVLNLGSVYNGPTP